MQIFDLTLPLDVSTPVYSEPSGYLDPPYRAEPWAAAAAQGYSVHRLEMGSHTGTHLDAPAHFHPGLATVDEVPVSALIGRAVVIELRSLSRVTAAALQPCGAAVQSGGLPLFLAPTAGVVLSADAVRVVASWHPRLILYAGQFLDETERHYHNRVWLGAGIPLVTDLDPVAAAQVQDGDLLITAPLPLVGLDGSPCRVFALRF